MQGAAEAEGQVDRVVSFRTFLKAVEEGATIPSVSGDDLRRLHVAWAEMTKRYGGKDGAMSLDMMSRVCSPGANLPAVWLRYRQVRVLVKRGILAEWQHSPDLDDAVYQVAATIPMNGLELGVAAFVRRLREEDDC